MGGQSGSLAGDGSGQLGEPATAALHQGNAECTASDGLSSLSACLPACCWCCLMESLKPYGVSHVTAARGQPEPLEQPCDDQATMPDDGATVGRAVL